MYSSNRQWTYLTGVLLQLSLLFQGCQAQVDSTNIGVIIGASVGGVILLVLLVILFMLLCTGSSSDDIRYLDDRSSRSSRSSRHSHHYKRPPPPRPVPPGVWTTMPHHYGMQAPLPKHYGMQAPLPQHYGMKAHLPPPPPPVIIPVRAPPRPVPPPPRRERLLQRTVRRAKTIAKRLPAIFQVRRFKPYVPPQVYASAAIMPITARQEELERKMRVGEEELRHTEQPPTLVQLQDNMRNSHEATAHAVHESRQTYERCDDTMAKAYSDYSFNGCTAKITPRNDETAENVARAYSSYSMDLQGHRVSTHAYDDIQNRARSDIGLARPSGLPTFNPYGSGVVMRHQLQQPTAARSSPQMLQQQLFSREDGRPLSSVADVHKREPRRVASANDPYALYAQPDKITRTSVVPPAPPPPPPPPPNQQQTTKSRDGFATTESDSTSDHDILWPRQDNISLYSVRTDASGMKVTADTFKFLEEYEDAMEFGSEE